MMDAYGKSTNGYMIVLLVITIARWAHRLGCQLAWSRSVTSPQIGYALLPPGTGVTLQARSTLL
jgi:hypothetical protein